MGWGANGDVRARRWASLRTGAVLLVALAAVVGCEPGGEPVPTESVTTTPAGPVELSAPLELAIVKETSPAPCTGETVPGPEGSECFTLGETMTVTEVEELTMATPTSGQSTEADEDVLQLTMTSADGADFYDLTARAAQLPDPRIAMVVDGEVISAPILAQAIPAGAVEISGWDGAQEFVAESTTG